MSTITSAASLTPASSIPTPTTPSKEQMCRTFKQGISSTLAYIQLKKCDNTWPKNMFPTPKGFTQDEIDISDNDKEPPKGLY